MEAVGPLGTPSGTPGIDALSAPIDPPPSTEHVTARPAPRVLVVEDDPSDMATVHAVLNDAGYHVHPAPDATMALRFLGRSTPDLILMDVGLPDRSGFELCRTVKSREEFADLPVIFLSGAYRLSDRMTAFACGAVDYLVKPFESAELLARIRTHLSLRRLQLDLETRVQERTAELAAANARLSASEERYRRITETITDYVYTVRIAEDGRRTTIHGPGSVAVTGYSPEDLAADPGLWIRMVLPDDRELVTENTSRFLAGEHVDAIEHRIVTKSGVERWVRNTFVPDRDEAGRLRGYDGLIQDITERKRAEEEVRTLNLELELRVSQRTSELAAANRELEAFVYSVSHDLRAPLQTIAGFGRILLEDHAATLDAEAQRVVGVMIRNTDRMGQLIDDLLSFSRVSRASMGTASVGMEELARTVADELLGLERSRQIEIEIGPLHPAVGDQAMLREVLVNLLGNSIKFTRTRPIAHIEVDSHVEGAMRRYEVRDNGVGFDMAQVDKLFGVFQRLHRPTEFEGTGIGLAIVARIVERHGGSVWAHGTVDEGATFCFTLPGVEAGLDNSPEERPASEGIGVADLPS